MSRLRWPGFLLPLLSLPVVLIAWEAAVRILQVPVILVPPPSAVAGALIRGFTTDPLSRASYFPHIATTVAEALQGFALGVATGIALAILLSQSRLAERIVLPWVVAFQTIPKVGLAPIFIIWFGFGMTSKVLVAAILTFFPILVNSLAGFKSVEQDRVDLLRSASATEWRIFRLVKWPSALPYIFVGLDLGIVYSFLGAIVGEFVGAQQGLGVLLLQQQSNLDIKGAFAIFVVMAVIGVALHLVVVAIQRRVIFWAPGSAATIST